MNQLLPGMVWIQLLSLPLGAFGAKKMSMDPSAFVFSPSAQAVDPGELLVGLEHAAGLGVVDRHRPVVLHRHLGRQVQLVGLGAVQGLMLRVQSGDAVVRARRPGLVSAIAGVTQTAL